MYGTEGRDLTFAAVGDAIVTRKFSVYEEPQFQTLINEIQNADVSLANLEVLLHDYEGYPSAQSGGTYMRAPPWVADELSWAGFDIFAAATNHAGDFSHGGMITTMEALEDRNIAYAGLGRNLAEARAPAYVDTPAGRVALVAACTTITPGTEAGQQLPNIHGRPGLSPLRLETRYTVPESAHDFLTELSENLGLEAVKGRRKRLGFPVPGEDTGAFTLMNIGGETDLDFKVGDEYAVRREANEGDVEAIRRQIIAARAQADWVIVSLHTHEGSGGFFNDDSVPAFLESFAHDCIDTGADAFVGHGPHVLRGIEIYDRAPIFYSLGNFFMQNETVTRLPAEIYDRYDLNPSESLPATLFDKRVHDQDENRIGFLSDQSFWESILPVCEYKDGRVDTIRLYPLDLGYEEPRPRRGRPVLADERTTKQILESVAQLSEPYGTTIEYNEEYGEINV
ncbi:CapA family protein [Halegenticoccus tardaugens]|uniref:CapA family protein n=1 Tax=Halegenticoccus tardaugens TaxID=2071624 RepID=UPI00100B5B24|nr:CapA family protein [Halegenticoccus tardaugens]